MACVVIHWQARRGREADESVVAGGKNPQTIRIIEAVLENRGLVPGCDERMEYLGFLDNDAAKKGTDFYGYPIFGGFEVLDDFSGEDIHFVNIITGTMAIRFETTREIVSRGFPLANLIHPSVDLRMTHIGVGNYIQEAVQIQAEVSIGNNTSIHMGTLIGHETKIGDSTFIAHAVAISGEVEIGDGVTIGTNSTILPRVKVGNWSTIGAGAVVIKDVPDYAVVVGNPAKVIKFNDETYSDGNVFGSLLEA